jgi:uncharacterized protein
MRMRCADYGARWALVLLLMLASSALAAEPKFPALTGRVVDDAHVLNASTQSELTYLLATHERTTGQQVVVVTLPSLQGYTIEDFGYQLGRHWGIGQKGTNTGAMLIVVPKEHKVRIEVGYGLEGTLTDATSRTIIENDIVPNFKRGDFNAGVLAGTTSMLQVLGGNPLKSEAEPSPTPIPFLSAPWQAYVGLVIWALFFFGAWGFFGAMWFRHRNDPHDWLTYGGGRGWSGGSSWGGGGSSGSDGGGFSGGGGSFGGGGASGSW